MTDTTSWAQLDPMIMIGGITGASSDDVTQGSLGQASVQKVTPLWHPDHPMFWFAGVALVTLGLAGASTHLRVGPFKLGAAAGKD